VRSFLIRLSGVFTAARGDDDLAAELDSHL